MFKITVLVIDSKEMEHLLQAMESGIELYLANIVLEHGDLNDVDTNRLLKLKYPINTISVRDIVL